jgi:hypothetical protein
MMENKYQKTIDTLAQYGEAIRNDIQPKQPPPKPEPKPVEYALSEHVLLF